MFEYVTSMLLALSQSIAWPIHSVITHDDNESAGKNMLNVDDLDPELKMVLTKAIAKKCDTKLSYSMFEIQMLAENTHLSIVQIRAFWAACLIHLGYTDLEGNPDSQIDELSGEDVGAALEFLQQTIEAAQKFLDGLDAEF